MALQRAIARSRIAVVPAKAGIQLPSGKRVAFEGRLDPGFRRDDERKDRDGTDCGSAHITQMPRAKPWIGPRPEGTYLPSPDARTAPRIPQPRPLIPPAQN